MSNEALIRKWQAGIVQDCERILKRELTRSETTFVTSRRGLMALEMIQDHVRSLTGKPEDLQRYLQSEDDPRQSG